MITIALPFLSARLNELNDARLSQIPLINDTIECL